MMKNQGATVHFSDMLTYCALRLENVRQDIYAKMHQKLIKNRSGATNTRAVDARPEGHYRSFIMIISSPGSKIKLHRCNFDDPGHFYAQNCAFAQKWRYHMLISCPECSRQVSDQAVSCPNCGYPISGKVPPSPTPKRTSQRALKFRRLPNGFGSIHNLGGRRRKPYGAFLPVTAHHLNGSPVATKAIGYFETYNEAYAALTAYHSNHGVPSECTFAQVYEKFLADKFEDPASQIEFADSTLKNYRWAYGKCSSLYDRPMNEIYRDDMQSIIDNLHLSYTSAGFMRTLFRGMFRYAVENGIVEKDYSDYIKIKQRREYEKGVPFTSEEIALLWEHKSNYNIQVALILIYSGLRISELKTCQIDLDNGVFVGGVKTAAGKNRTVPIHSKVLPLVEEFDQGGFSVGNYQDRLFNKALTALGFPNAATGEKHTPHDCRHTFSWLADKWHMDELAKHLIMGHSLGKDVEKNTYGHRTLDELRSEMERIQE